MLRFDYGEASPTRPPRRVEPHHLVTWSGRWYLVAWDLDRTDWRTFRVDRLRPITPTGPRFDRRELPASDVATYISEKFASPPLPCRGEIIVHAPPQVVTRWAGPTAVVEALDADRCRVTASSWSWTGLAAWANMFDADLEIVGPGELRAAAEHLSSRFAAASSVRHAGG